MRYCKKKTFIVCIALVLIGMSGCSSSSDKTIEALSQELESAQFEAESAKAELESISKAVETESDKNIEENSYVEETEPNTKSAEQEMTEFVSDCKIIDYESLYRDPMKYLDEKIVIYDAVFRNSFNNDTYWFVQVDDGYGNKENYVLSNARRNSSMNLMADDIINVYGVCAGTFTGELSNGFGAKTETKIPCITAFYIDFQDPTIDDEFQNDVDKIELADEEHDQGDEYIIPYSDSMWITDTQASLMSTEELRYARNEIYARHGRRFTDKTLQAYFDSKDWYHGTIDPEDFDEGVLSDIENDNIALLEKYEK